MGSIVVSTEEIMHPLLLDLPDQILTPRLSLRPYRAGDGPAYFAVCQRNRDHLPPFERGNPALDVQTVEDAGILVRRFAADWAARAAFFLGAWARESGAFAAQIYVGPVNWDGPEFTIGYFVDVAHEGRGDVTEAVRGVLGWLFGTAGAHRVRLECNEANLRSQRVAERCGFVLEGHLRQTRPHPLQLGAWSGDLIYGLLREEYEKQ